MSTKRDALWYLLYDRDGQVAELDRELDRAIEIDALQRVRHEDLKASLERLGFDVSELTPLPPIDPSELRCSAHPTDDTDIEALIVEAQRSPLDKLHDEVQAAKPSALRARTSDTPASGEVIIHDPPVLARRNVGQVLGVR